jgi:hypothetical protein
MRPVRRSSIKSKKYSLFLCISTFCSCVTFFLLYTQPIETQKIIVIIIKTEEVQTAGKETKVNVNHLSLFWHILSTDTYLLFSKALWFDIQDRACVTCCNAHIKVREPLSLSLSLFSCIELMKHRVFITYKAAWL